ncbi:DUF7524 family protein [Natronobacterium gregoryi]|uniref:Uncharacterized protein n=2 Tax=Natronobacterium gregoryi TaxID=44930 RepID=L0AF99_NATGS|nr:hypothetical protein [Natronobacterium gregoryi]AFZ72089.1 hypothetical protein Natgr_0848 [Natronobacterium gregoryi SP2]ELY62881.1 hypothetical protein C490_17008 [Natronobacterium gregoryi SP2]PLK20063.1 hypothetical protein CYV19_11565 [Natronobacterium gregoryi SP2]SFJ58003.1 hypothetical protein SAMN05443661_1422 [Natronobacterium gregoryi]
MLSNEVTVHVNRGESDTLELESADGDRLDLEVSRSFRLTLRGHETPAHVHCRLDGGLSHIASIDHPNYYVGPGDVTSVPVEIDADGVDALVEGQLEVLTGYGSESVTVEVIVTPGSARIDVDESLAEPSRDEPEPPVLERVSSAAQVDPGTLAVGALGLFAIAIATMTAMTIASPAALVGLGAVIVGVAVAGLLLVR